MLFLRRIFLLSALFAAATAQNYVQQTFFSGSGCTSSVGAIQIVNPSCWPEALEKYTCDGSGNYVRYGCDDSACNVCELSESVTAICEVYTPRNTDSVDKRCAPLPSSYPAGSVIITTYPSTNCQGAWGRRAVYAPGYCLGGIKYTCSGDSITMTSCTDTSLTAGCLGTGMFECYAGGNTGSAPQAAPTVVPTGNVGLAPTSSSPVPVAAPVAAGNAPTAAPSPKATAPAPVRSPLVGTPSSSSSITVSLLTIGFGTLFVYLL